MTQLIKDLSGRWVKSTNNFDFNEFQDNNKTIPVDTISTVYLPVHNIKDIYEWYRIFQDSYLFTDNIDKYGFGMHAYFNKSRGESIKGWFPNLVEVKASSSNTYKYYNDGIDYLRSSVDYITSFTNLETLFIDEVEIFNTEKILLKNQLYHTLDLYGVDLTLSNTPKIIYANIVSGEEQYFKIGSTLVIKDSSNTFIEEPILNISYDTIGLNDYVVITVKNAYDDIAEVADKFNGNYILTSDETTNGVYEYLDNELILINDMFDKYKTYQQIIYTYQGLTNSNKQFYLRRNEIKFDPRYSLFPISGISEPMYYSEGEAYLVKYEFKYNLSVEASTVQNINEDCCGCSSEQTNIEHPTGYGPYTYDQDPFRLMYLDYDQAYKIFATSGLGAAKYVLEGGADLSDLTGDIEFSTLDEDLNDNFLVEYYDKYFTGSSEPITEAIKFKYYEYSSTETLNPIFDSSLNAIDVNTDFVHNDNVANDAIDDTTTIALTYTGTQDILPPGFTFNPGSLVNIDFTFVGDTSLNNAFNGNFQIISISQTLTNLDIEIFPALDKNFVHELKQISELGSFLMEMDFINVYGMETGGVILDRTKSLLKKLNKSIFGQVYNFNFVLDIDLETARLELNNIRNRNEFIYDNLKNTITTVVDTYYINHEIGSNATIYNSDYSITKYLNDYLNIGNQNLTTFNNFSITYDNTEGSSSHLRIEGSNKLATLGNIIYFGSDYKETVLDNLGKDTVLNLQYDINDEDVWVTDVFFDEDEQIGQIVLLDYIPISTNGINVDFNVQFLSVNVSSKLKEIFDNEVNEAETQITINNVPYKVDTASYAYQFMHKTTDDKLINTITGMMFKEYNEPRVTFFKRDKFFDFEEDPIVEITVASTIDEDITLASASIDTYVLSPGDLILLKDQSDLTENGIYIFDGAGNPLLPYEEEFNTKIYWLIINGATNINKLFVTYFELPLTTSSDVLFYEKTYKRKSDPRLSLKPTGIFKLGVDNKTQPERKINKKYDLIETSENVISIIPGVNSINQIRFIDGLSEFNILNNINGQGQYAWILNDEVITENAVVGCTQDSGPGTGTLIWYTGTWVIGTWCYGIWMQGLWKDGIWMNGIWNAYGIQDNITYVIVNNLQNNLLSKWENGTWVNGTFNSGIIDFITWLNGTFNNGIINDGTWETGTFNNGIAKHLIWETGTFYGGDFETGIWKNGVLNQLDPSIPARFGINSSSDSANYSSRAIWKKGNFEGGSFHSGNNNTQHNSSIFYSGEFKNATWLGGSFIAGQFVTSTWYDGVWFGGYKCTISDDAGSQKLVEFQADTYDVILGLDTTVGYEPFYSNNLYLYNPAVYLTATPTANSSFTDITFINVFDQVNSGTYTSKEIITGSSTDQTNILDATLLIDISIVATVVGTTYVAADLINNIPDGDPFICAEFTGTWKGGLWLNGLFKSGNFEAGQWVNGYAIDITFGIL